MSLSTFVSNPSQNLVGAFQRA